jgi:hypothetical protein
MLAFADRQQVYLSAAGCESARVLTPDAKKDELGYIAEIKSDAAAV